MEVVNVWYALGVGGGKWVEIRQSTKPPKMSLTSLRIGDRLFPLRTFRGGLTKAVVTRAHFRATVGGGALTGVKRLTQAEAAEVMK